MQESLRSFLIAPGHDRGSPSQDDLESPSSKRRKVQTKSWKTADCRPKPVCVLLLYVNKVLLPKHNHAHSFLYCLWQLSSQNSRVA